MLLVLLKLRPVVGSVTLRLRLQPLLAGVVGVRAADKVYRCLHRLLLNPTLVYLQHGVGTFDLVVNSPFQVYPNVLDTTDFLAFICTILAPTLRELAPRRKLPLRAPKHRHL